MRTFLSILCLLALAACANVVSTTKAQQTIDLLVAGQKVTLQAENIYLSQSPCGLAGSSPPPLCASLAVGVQWRSLDDKLKAAIALAQSKVDVVGTDPKVLDAAIAAAQLALAEIQNFTSKYEVKK